MTSFAHFIPIFFITALYILLIGVVVWLFFRLVRSSERMAAALEQLAGRPEVSNQHTER